MSISEPGSAPIEMLQSPADLLFAQFDLNKVVQYGASLLGAEEKNYDLENGSTSKCV